MTHRATIATIAIVAAVVIAITKGPQLNNTSLGREASKNNAAIYFITESQTACTSLTSLDTYINGVISGDKYVMEMLLRSQKCMIIPRGQSMRFSNDFTVTTANIGGGDNEVIKIVYPKITLWVLRLSTTY